MNVYRPVFYPILLLAISVGCATKEKETATTHPASLSEISHLYADLVPYIYNSEAFEDSKNKLFIKTKMDQLNHRVIQMQAPYLERPMDCDPVVLMGLNNMRSSLQEGLGSFYVQSFSYAQKQLKQSFEDFIKLTAFFQEEDVHSDNWEVMMSDTQGSLDQGDIASLQVAVQKYPKAIETLMFHLRTGNLRESDQLDVIKRIMVISVKNMHEPALALAVIKDIRRNPQMQTHSPILNRWSRYLTQATKHPRSAILESAYANQFKTDGSFVEMLDKATVLHDSLGKVNDKGKRASILFALGQLYAKNKELGFKNMPALYFERCIKELPYSGLSERCYFSLEEEVRSQYGLSLADNLPKAEKYHMIELRYLTRPLISQKQPKIGISNYVDY